MSKLTRRTVILAKTNTSGNYGEDPSPAAEDGILCNMTPSIQPDGDVIEREVIRDTMSPQGHVIGAKYNSLELEAELKGGGVDTDVVQPPEFDPLLLASGLQKQTGSTVKVVSGDNVTDFTLGETVTGGTSSATGTVVQKIGNSGGQLALADVSGTFEDAEDITGDSSSTSATVDGTPDDNVIYHPQSDPDSIQDVGIYYHMDGIRFKALGGIGDMSLNVTVNEIPSITFSINSLYATPSDISLPSPSTVDLVPPKAYNLGLKLGDYTPIAANALTLSMNNDVTRLNDINATYGIKKYTITDRNPQGSVDPEIDSLANFNPYTKWENVSTAAVSGTWGDTKGNRVGLTALKGIYRRVEHNDRNGYRTYNLPFTCRIADTAGGGDDEFYLIFT